MWKATCKKTAENAYWESLDKSELKKQRLMIEYLESQEKEVKVNRYKVGSQWRFGSKRMPG